MLRIVMLLVVAISIVTPSWAEESEHTPDLFVIVTTADPVTQLMSMVLATETVKKGKQVDILLCGEAGSMAVKDSPQILLKPKNVSPQTLLQTLIKSGVEVEICPPYLPNNEVSESMLIEGVQVAKPGAVAEKLLHDKTKILSY